MTRVAPPQVPAAANAGDEGAVAAALDDLSWLDAGAADNFADALQNAQPRLGEDETAPLPNGVQADAGLAPAAPEGQAAVPAKPSSTEGEDEESKPAKPVDAALTPALQPAPAWQLLQAIMPSAAQPGAAPAAASAGIEGLSARGDAEVSRTASAPADSARQALTMNLSEQLAALADKDAAAPASPAPAILPAALRLPESGQKAEPFALSLPAAKPESWSGKLQAALGERLQVMSSQSMDRATIRLDPPALGTLEIAIRHQAGALTVEFTASHGEVVRQLQNIGDALRQDLNSRQYTQVAVEVREGALPGQGQGGRQGREQQQSQPGRALQLADEAETESFRLS
ncbi:flagellar hook-length control protein FliK [Chromobacterium sp. IIBBL 290-4]|uniref:flagellar hook-length control protein FliK n=1 Tax=Chromobacterium sp. IIBBL 290-4 TaxID=2953890 RepID=UPI0020B796F4|nr:flagellar hook-length control protein FliK [Chromobacterium sp. IIBBL 290-4]UTH73153.1 flagellar hook-length control protein FliK [Chromobacterium sp. IIBBL 290-4]